MDERPDFLDEALDEALASYGKLPENKGLERRILEGVPARAARARRMRISAAALCAAAAAAGLLFWPAPPREPARSAVVLSSMPQAPKPPAAVREFAQSGRFAPEKTRRSGRKQRVEPKLPVFPIPVSIGRQERALLQLANYKAQHSAQDLSYLGNAVTPVQIAEVEIKPMANRGEANAEMDDGSEFGGADEPHMPGAN